MAYTWGIDIHSEIPMTLAKLQKLYAAGARILVIKASMGFGDDAYVAERVNWGKQLGFVTGIYHWIDPTNTADAQIERFAKWINQVNPDFGSGDHEQWWSDWDLYFAYLRGEIPASAVPKLTADQIDSVGKAFLAGIKARFPKFFNFCYTAQWFDTYDPLMKSWIGQYPGWYAAGDKYFGPHTYTTWAPFYNYLDSLAAYIPAIPQGASKCTLLQFTGKAHLPEIDSELDVNYFNGTEQQFRDLVHFNTVTVIPYIVNKLNGIYLHKGANSASPKTKWLANGTEVLVQTILPNRWALTADGFAFTPNLRLKDPPVADNIVHYRVSSPGGTYIQTEPNWNSAALRYVTNGADLSINANYTATPGWLQLKDGGYVAANRVTQVTP